ncbi:MAG: glucosidase, partial [Chlamydiae bacterium]|nr:glucosidase [Chlamydiota bacterium]
MPLKEVNRKHSNEGERKRLAEPMGESFTPPWFKWGPYVSERSWGTVREDYSANGDAWSYFPFDDAYRKAYRWGDDAIAGWCDRYQILIFAPVFWNGKDLILKERLFGLSSSEGNHGEDVKEQYFHVDATPTHSYMKYLYKYPIDEFPYQKLKEENKKRDSFQSEYELIDTGVFNNDRYFDIFIEYVKVSSEDTIVKIEAFNRSNQVAPLHLIPHLWFRNRWSWFENPGKKPEIYKGCSTKDYDCLIANDESSDKLSNLPFEYTLDKRYLYFQKDGEILFTDNETCHQEHKHTHNHYKDAFNRHIIQGDPLAYNERGTKACVHYKFASIQPKSSVVVYLRLTDEEKEDPFYKIHEIIDSRKTEADEFYEGIHPKKASSEEKMIQRQALSSLIWNKQIYLYDISLWLDGDNKKMPPPASRKYIRNQHWRHLNSMRILSMPDKWEYPWFAAWDLAFQCVGWALIDTKFAKDQIWLLLFDQFQHPNGQIPAYEWEFSDLNPPIQAWAALKVFLMEFEQTGNKDIVFLEKCFHKLLMNFSWWVNKVDSAGNNVFEGGFLGLDNIAVLD